MRLSGKRRLKYTKLLVLVSIAGSFLSFFTGKMGFGELYPFATWKLYTQPLGNKHVFEEYRIYTLAPGATTWQRQPVITNSDNFTKDEYVYTLNHLVAGALAPQPDSLLFKNRLRAFVRYVAPPANAYKIVRETYQPLQHLQHPQQYDTLTVIRF